jgi:hypothetical protein
MVSLGAVEQAQLSESMTETIAILLQAVEAGTVSELTTQYMQMLAAALGVFVVAGFMVQTIKVRASDQTVAIRELSV